MRATAKERSNLIPYKQTQTALVGFLLIARVAFAHDDHPIGQQYDYQSTYRVPDSSHRAEHRDLNAEHRAGHQDLDQAHINRHEQLNRRYEREMRRLARQERQAKELAYSRYNGDIYDPDYQARIARIERRFANRRTQVARELGWEHREGHQDLSAEHRAQHQDLTAEHRDYHDYAR